MMTVEALRLVAIESLCPTQSLKDGGPWPTLAKDVVSDSEAVAVDKLHPKRYTPSLAVYTEESAVSQHGEIDVSTHGVATATLSIEAELAVIETDKTGSFPDAAHTDPKGKLMLGALCAQVRRRLVYDPAGLFAWPQLVAQVERINIRQFAAPEFGLRFLRSTMQFHCRIADDKFSDAGGLPEPVNSIFGGLPAESYAKAKLAELAAAFAVIERQPLELITIVESEDDDPTGSVDYTE